MLFPITNRNNPNVNRRKEKQNTGLHNGILCSFNKECNTDGDVV